MGVVPDRRRRPEHPGDADDSNFFRDRYGLINANTGDIDASGLNVIDATDSVIRGKESADEAPWQTMAAALVDLASEDGGGVTRPAATRTTRRR